MDSSREDRFCLEKIALVGKDVLNWAIQTQMGNLGSVEGFVLRWGIESWLEDILHWGRWTQWGVFIQLERMDSAWRIKSWLEDILRWG